jgi:predicted carbohydrate-binding protein with CBM5 and CBM33 domain
MTTADWNPSQPLNWGQMEFLGRPSPTLTNMHYKFDVMIPQNRVGHHVLWIAWHRDDPVGEVFFSTSDLMIAPPDNVLAGDFNANNVVDAADYTTWRDRVGSPAGNLPNDVDGGVIGTAQYARWKTNFGAKRGVAAAVPEPAAAILLAFAAICGSWRRQRYSM